jgi:hypothetical protein
MDGPQKNQTYGSLSDCTWELGRLANKKAHGSQRRNSATSTQMVLAKVFLFSLSSLFASSGLNRPTTDFHHLDDTTET